MVKFPNPSDVFVETVDASSAGDDTDAELSLASDRSASDLGPGDTLPPLALYGASECRAIFSLRGDRVPDYRVCGAGATTCGRPHHTEFTKAAPGYYAPLPARRGKYIDGRFDSFVTEEEHRDIETRRKTATSEALAAASLLVSDRKPAANPPPSPESTPAQASPPPRSTLVLEARLEALEKMLARTGGPPPVDDAGLSIPTATPRLPPALKQPPASLSDKTTPPAFSPAQASDLSTPRRSGPTFAVVNEKTGDGGVFSLREEAQKQSFGIRGARMKKFLSFEEAERWVDDFIDNWQDPGEDLVVDGRPPVASPPPSPFMPDDRAAPVQVTPDHCPPYTGTLTRMDKGYLPPPELMGVDPSKGKDGELFGVELDVGEDELMAAFCPPDVSADMAQAMIDGTIDAVALPGALSNGSDLGEGGAGAESTDTAALANSLQELVTGKKLGRTDMNWRTDKRTSLRAISTPKKLRERLSVLRKLQAPIEKRMTSLTTSGCKQSGWTDPFRMHAWSTQGFLPVMTRASLAYYIALHEHLDELTTKVGWSYAKVELDYFVQELHLIRLLATSRINCLGSLYCFLRDMKAKKWYSHEVQDARNQEFAAHKDGSLPLADSGGLGGGPAPPPSSDSPLICPHCRTMLHGADSHTCPWKGQSTEKARTNAARALRQLGTGAKSPSPGKKVNKDQDKPDQA